MRLIVLAQDERCERLAELAQVQVGEAVGHAALLNTLSYYPDDATIPLDYNYNIKAIAAIAPVDGQYEPGNTRSALKNINYFVLHGSQDADMSSYAGSKQYERISYTDSSYYFKSGLYIYGANHGQFNTSWGNNDVGTPFTRFLNLEQLLPAEEQREIAKVYLSAFLETTLKDNKDYLPLFADARKGKNWLPETIYLNQFEDASFEPIAKYDEDFEVTTATADSVAITSKKLTVWKEKEIQLKWGKKGSRAAYIGWHYDEEKLTEKDSSFIIPDSIVASYSLKRPYPFKAIDSTAALVFSLAEASGDTNPKTKGKWIIENENEEAETENEQGATNTNTENGNQNTDAINEDGDKEEDKVEEPIDFTISITDANGQKVQFPLSRFSALQRQMDIVLWKIDDLMGESQSENVFQTYIFALAKLKTLNPTFDYTQIQQIDFVFNKTTKGIICLDNLGFMKTFP